MATEQKYIELNRGYCAVVDADDYPRLSIYRWTAMRKRNHMYAFRKDKETEKMVFMHREVMGCVPGDGKIVDHVVYTETLNNMKGNLRFATTSQNGMNRGAQSNCRSGRKGVVWNKQRQRWMAQIGVGGRPKYLGLYDDLDQAHAAYVKAAVVLYGEYAHG